MRTTEIWSCGLRDPGGAPAGLRRCSLGFPGSASLFVTYLVAFVWSVLNKGDPPLLALGRISFVAACAIAAATAFLSDNNSAHTHQVRRKPGG